MKYVLLVLVQLVSHYKILIRKGHKVLMIEFGGNENKQSNLFGINSIINNGHTENLGRSFQYGGTSISGLGE